MKTEWEITGRLNCLQFIGEAVDGFYCVHLCGAEQEAVGEFGIIFAQGQSCEDFMFEQCVSNFVGGSGAFQQDLVKCICTELNFESAHLR